MKAKVLVLVWAMLFVGKFSFAQEINSNKVSLKSNNSNSSNTVTLIVDKQAPDITFFYPQLKRGFKVISNESNVEMRGLITDRGGVKFLKINGQNIEFSKSGNFIHQLFLAKGDQTVVVEVMDNFKNYKKETFTIQYNEPVIVDYPNYPENNENIQGKYYALIIGISEYTDQSIINLDKPIQDAEKLYNVLTTNYTFNKEDVVFLKNPTRAEMIDALDSYSNTITPADNFLIFYAGHGYWDENSKIGYWLPADSKRNSKAAWFRNSTLRDYLKEVDSKHTLLIADACFGGGIFKTRKAFSDAPASINLLYELPSRKAMTSGTLTEVPDESAFIKFLVKRLSQNNKKYLTAEQLFSSLRSAVINNSEVVPQYGEIKNVGDEGGDFIFIKK